ncbi:hypothetical protein F1559_001407 [Cyanidiococcus yangmingshanensis]|uniref:Uncharacterized protein n=1 Tax=Cyanidiococcus yangmingshanensis TaxID=2690220 RepID=A0A7J7INU5_9RHOD|nr:hypothetical protein F1559_001407 [Cyanidiococcus yangmingshanensis]
MSLQHRSELKRNSGHGAALERLERRLVKAWEAEDGYLIEQLAGMIYDRLVRSEPTQASVVLEQNARRLAQAGKPAEAAELAIRLVRHWREIETRPFDLDRLQQIVLNPLQSQSGVEAARARAMVLEAALAWCRAASVAGTEPPKSQYALLDALVDAYVLCAEWPRAQYQVLCRGGPAERDLAFLDEQLGPHLGNEVERMLARTRFVLFYSLVGNHDAAQALAAAIQEKHPSAPLTNLTSFFVQVLDQSRNADANKRRALRSLVDELRRVYRWAFTLDPELSTLVDDILKARNM